MITVVGSINCDYVLKMERFPNVGETIHIDSLSIVPGGKGANQAVTSAKLGEHVLFIVAMGSDPMAEFLESSLRRYGNLDCKVIRSSKKTGMAFIEVDEKGDNKIMVFRGANGELSFRDVLGYEDMMKRSDTILLQCEIPLDTNLEMVKRFRGKTVILDPSPVDSFSEELLNGIAYITPNRTEFREITGIDPENPEDILKGAEYFFKFDVGNLVLKDGENGAYLVDRNEKTVLHAIPPKVDAIDTTAAGDVFNGSFAVFLSRGIRKDEALKMAVATATLSVTKLGAQTSIPSEMEVRTSGLMDRVVVERL
ncbi:MAG: ribokinase [Thermotogae bacterium]|nr:ribokinase [Thermotogota bacterium]